jgi:hypothetical protein
VREAFRYRQSLRGRKLAKDERRKIERRHDRVQGGKAGAEGEARKKFKNSREEVNRETHAVGRNPIRRKTGRSCVAGENNLCMSHRSSASQLRGAL